MIGGKSVVRQVKTAMSGVAIGGAVLLGGPAAAGGAAAVWGVTLILRQVDAVGQATEQRLP